MTAKMLIAGLSIGFLLSVGVMIWKKLESNEAPGHTESLAEDGRTIQAPGNAESPAESSTPIETPPYMYWNCNLRKNEALQCSVQNHSPKAAAELCLDATLVCGGARHSVPWCSGPIRPGYTSQKIITGFKPPIQPEQECIGFQFTNELTQNKVMLGD